MDHSQPGTFLFNGFKFRTAARGAVLFVGLLLLISACDILGEEQVREQNVYPAYVDADTNGRNDYVEIGTHAPGLQKANRNAHSDGVAPPGHGFVDDNGDEICDYAQNGSATWHGPGFVDKNGNGVSDYWDEASPRHERHRGFQFQDRNRNHVNDHVEESTHWGAGHGFIDTNGDGICDRAQDGSPTWHGPNFVDEDGNGRCDYWELGGRGHGGHHGRG